MPHLVTAASTFSFASDRPGPWWRRLTESIGRLGRAVRVLRGLGRLEPRLLAAIGR
jgi:hypothetical protein